MLTISKKSPTVGYSRVFHISQICIDSFDTNFATIKMLGMLCVRNLHSKAGVYPVAPRDKNPVELWGKKC